MGFSNWLPGLRVAILLSGFILFLYTTEGLGVDKKKIKLFIPYL